MYVWFADFGYTGVGWFVLYGCLDIFCALVWPQRVWWLFFPARIAVYVWDTAGKLYQWKRVLTKQVVGSWRETAVSQVTEIQWLSIAGH